MLFVSTVIKRSTFNGTHTTHIFFTWFYLRGKWQRARCGLHILTVHKPQRDVNSVLCERKPSVQNLHCYVQWWKSRAAKLFTQPNFSPTCPTDKPLNVRERALSRLNTHIHIRKKENNHRFLAVSLWFCSRARRAAWGSWGSWLSGGLRRSCWSADTAASANAADRRLAAPIWACCVCDRRRRRRSCNESWWSCSS